MNQGTMSGETRSSDWLERISVIISGALLIILSNYTLKDLVHSYFDDVTVENGAMENEIQFLHGGVENSTSHAKL